MEINWKWYDYVLMFFQFAKQAEFTLYLTKTFPSLIIIITLFI